MWLAVEVGIDEDWDFDGVPIMGVMRRDREAPCELAGVGIEGDDAAGIGIDAGARLAIKDGCGVAGSPVDEVEFGIVGAGHPGHGAGGAVGRAYGRRAIPLPLRLAGLGVERAKIAAEIVE